MRFGLQDQSNCHFRRQFPRKIVPTTLVTMAVLAGGSFQLLGERIALKPTISGTLLIQWNDESRFIYVPDPDHRLKFVTRDKREIIPERMYTDGGSIPRVFWSVKGFSPWGYGPAYVLHDWLFHQHRCHFDNTPNKFSLGEANQVLDDAIEYLMVTKKVADNQIARRLIKWGVDNFAKTAWNEPCDPAPAAQSPEALATAIIVGRISFSD